jgi:hypothetical protein
VIQICNNDITIEGRLIRIAHLDGQEFVFLDDPETVLNGLRKSRTRIDIFTFLQKLPAGPPTYPYPMEWDNLAVMPVSTFEQWTQQVHRNVRVKIRKAEKMGVVVREARFDSALLQGICQIYNECPVRLGKRFPHYGMGLEKAHEYAGTFLDRSIFIGAFLGDSLIGFIKLVTDKTRTQACVLHILSMVQHKDKAPTNALIAQAVRSCAQRGILYLTYGKFAYGRDRVDGLSHFKEVNGFQHVKIPRYYIPLTGIGRTALHLGLHHRFADHLPEAILAKFRELRKAWYGRKFQATTEI